MVKLKVERQVAIANSDYRINNQIRAREVRLIIEEQDDKGIPTSNNIGVVSLQEAMRTAQDLGLDLVEVAPDYDPTGSTSTLAAQVLMNTIGRVLHHRKT